MKFFSFLIFLTLITACASPDPVQEIQGIKLPEGFEITLYADVPNARSLALAEDGTVFVGTRKDRVYALKDIDMDYRADWVKTIIAHETRWQLNRNLCPGNTQYSWF